MRSYVWKGHWVSTSEVASGFDCADSWRHMFGRAKGLKLHRTRFESTVGLLPKGLWEGGLELLDVTADLFPRLSVRDGFFRLDIRPAPPARTTTDLTLTEAPDPRKTPLVKGPDLGRLAEYRRIYAAGGTDDVILGTFAETTTGALVGWSGNVLVVPGAVHLPSTTLALVIARAHSRGIRVIHGSIDPCEPMWFLNALHGISPVHRIVTDSETLVLPHYPAEKEWCHWWWTTGWESVATGTRNMPDRPLSQG